jgi:hypothetical protein
MPALCQALTKRPYSDETEFTNESTAMSHPTSESVTIVSGLPRSGTSMMMKMLEAGGMPILTDNIRTADDDNPKGYYEFERVKNIREDQDWIPDAVGKVVKIISFLLLDMPSTHHYKVIFMRRAVPEVLASQKQMLIRRGEPTDSTSDDRMADIYAKHIKQAEKWIADNASVDVLYINHRDVINDPRSNATKVNAFLGDVLDEDAMGAIVDASLYRQRA